MRPSPCAPLLRLGEFHGRLVHNPATITWMGHRRIVAHKARLNRHLGQKTTLGALIPSTRDRKPLCHQWRPLSSHNWNGSQCAPCTRILPSLSMHIGTERWHVPQQVTTHDITHHDASHPASRLLQRRHLAIRVVATISAGMEPRARA